MAQSWLGSVGSRMRNREIEAGNTIYMRDNFVRTNVGPEMGQTSTQRTFTHFTSLIPEHGPTQAKNKSVQPRFQHMELGI